MQERADAKFADDVKKFEAAKQDWIAANIINRDNGLPLTQFTAATPVHVFFAADENGDLKQTQVPYDSPAPELPPATPKIQNIATGFFGGGSTQDPQANDRILAETLQLVRQIAAYFPAPQ